MRAAIQRAPALFGALCLATSACSPPRVPEPGAKRHLKVAFSPFLSQAPLYIAQDEGLFARHGLEVEFIRLASSSDGLPALDKGGLDVLCGSPSASVFNAVARGARIRIVGDKGHLARDGCDYGVLLARPDLLAGGRLIVPQGATRLRVSAERASMSGFIIETLLADAGLALDDVEIVDVPESVLVDAFARGRIDAAYVAEPWLARLRRAGVPVWKRARELAPDTQSAVVLYGRTLLDDRVTGVRFMTAYLEGVARYAEGKTERNVAIVANNTGLDSEIVREACWIAVREDGRVNRTSVLAFQEWSLGRGLLSLQARPEDLFDDSFAAAASPVRR